MFFQSQAFSTEKSHKKPDFVEKSRNFKTWLQKNQIGNPVVTWSEPLKIYCDVIITQ